MASFKMVMYSKLCRDNNVLLQIMSRLDKHIIISRIFATTEVWKCSFEKTAFWETTTKISTK